MTNEVEAGRFWRRLVKRSLLIERLCLFSILLALVHVVLNASRGMYGPVFLDVLFAFLLFIGYVINRFGHHRAAKIFVLLTLNMLFAITISMLPKDSGLYLYYFPLIVASSVVFDGADRLLRYVFVLLPIAAFTVLALNDFDLIPGYQFHRPPDDTFFMLNAFSAAAITVVCVNFMQQLNAASEHELQQLAEEVYRKNVNLEKTNAELDRFLYSTSHDLRSPLSSIKGLVNIARMETRDQNLLKYLTMMVDRVERLDSFIKDIIDYSKNARTEVRNEPVDFTSLVDEVAENLKYSEGAESITFRSEICLDRPVNADRGRLSVVLNNLMANAIKYHDPQKDSRWIGVSVSNSQGTIKVKVSDNGMGIAPEHQAKIFDMFYRGTEMSKGSGLGLYIVKEAVAKMKGTISVQSVPGEGSEFLITLPAL